MKKLLAVVLAVATFALALSPLPVVAQGAAPNQASYTAQGTGVPDYNLNSTGSSYGQIQNISGSVWGLGTGTSATSNGTSVINWNANNQAMIGTVSVLNSNVLLQVGANTNSLIVRTNGELESRSGTAPGVSSCGTSPSVVSGSDVAGDVTTGFTNSSVCTITFANAFTNIPHCACSNRSRAAFCTARATATTVVLTGSASAPNNWSDSDALDYICIGHQ